MKKYTPNIAVLDSTSTRYVPDRCRSAKIRSGTSGCGRCAAPPRRTPASSTHRTGQRPDDGRVGPVADPGESVAARSTPYTSRVTPSVPVTAPVRSNRPPRVAGSGSARGASSDQRDPDRHVDQQHPAPGQPGGDRAAGDQAERAADRGDGHVRAQRPGPQRPLRERGRDQRQRRRGRAGRTDALQRAADQQLPLVLGQPAEQRGDREQHQPGHEHPAQAEDVPGPAAEQQQPAERHRVRGDDPGQAGVGEAERPLDRRQRDVDHGRVEQEHQLGDRDHPQRQPLVPPAGSGPPVRRRRSRRGAGRDLQPAAQRLPQHLAERVLRQLPDELHPVRAEHRGHPLAPQVDRSSSTVGGVPAGTTTAQTRSAPGTAGSG